ncbi:MAG: C-GCAxxG-C-C family protein [Deltaproteobacteria bacterium]|nr:C-GCAxxG-C-C family protein [Deltaproteobacteria bacterium]
MSDQDKAKELFGRGFACSQAVLAGFAPRLGMDEQQALQVSRLLHGSLGLGLPCGALLGAWMALGLSRGDVVDNDRPTRMAANEPAREIARRFEEEHGSIFCKDLLGLHLGDPEQYRQAQEKEVFKKQCPLYVATAAKLLEEILG